MNVRALQLCFVTNLQNQSFSQYRSTLLKAVEGGITSVQLREKVSHLSAFRELALQIKQTLRPFHVPLIINDRVDVAKEIDADGVHLGQSDLSPTEARRILGPSKIIGWSVESLSEVEAANQLSCLDYVAASAVFPSRTKPDCKTIWGLNGLQKVVLMSQHPVVAIGGINLGNIGKIIEMGASGVAVIGALHTDNPKKSAAELISEIEYTLNKRVSLCMRR